MDLRQMLVAYQREGLSRTMASARVCQDIILKAIADGPFSRNVTVKGGVVMRSITNNNRRATRDIDIDFIHYSLSDDSIKAFVHQMNVINGISIDIEGTIEELRHQDYHGKGINLRITDEKGYSIVSKMDIGVHKHFDLAQDEYVFEVCMSDEGVELLKNSVEQSFVEKLRSLLKFGSNSHRYKDVYDLFYLKDLIDTERLNNAMNILVFKDPGMREKNYSDVLNRITKTFEDQEYLNAVSRSWQRWLDDDIQNIVNGILTFLTEVEEKEKSGNLQ